MAFYQSIVDQCYVYGCIWKYCETWNGRDSAAFILSERKCIMELFCLLSEWKCGNVYIECTLVRKSVFSRLTVPISNVLCSVIRFGIQMLLVVILLGYYIWKGAVSPHWEALLLIFFTFTMAWLHGDGSRDSDLQCDDKIQRSFSTGGLWNVTMDVWHTGGLSNEHFT